MGKQSARLYYQGNDHKDINFRGCLHDKMYVGGSLVWEKLYPDAYFLTTRTVYANDYSSDLKYITTILSKDGVEERVQCIAPMSTIEPFYYSTYFLINDMQLNQKYVYGEPFRKQDEKIKISGGYITPDFKRFIVSSQYEGEGIGENGFYSYSRNTIYKINEDLTVTEVQCDEIPQIENRELNYPFNYNAISLGNYLYYGNCTTWEKENGMGIASSYFYVIDENGKGTLHQKEYKFPVSAKHEPLIVSDEATDYAIDMELSDPFGSDIAIVIGNFAYIPNLGGTSVIFGSEYSGGAASKPLYMIRRNLSTWETENILFYDVKNDLIVNFRTIYASVNKALFIARKGGRYGGNYRAVVVKIEENISYKEISDFFINVYGEERSIIVRSIYEDSIITKDEIKIADTTNISINYLGVTMSKGVYKPDAVDGIAFYFSYGNQGYWYISGYMYIDNQDFAESENNYIYLLEEYENGELIFSR